jgi:hypothetical protein
VFSVAFLTFGACSGDRGQDLGTWVAEWDTIGDTVVVRTISGSLWGEPRKMIEDLSIGVLEGPEQLMLGSIVSLAVDDEGGIYAFDSQVPALRYFNAAGAYVRTLGRKGGGPGEYSDFVGTLAVRRDGKIVLPDVGSARLSLYEPEGTVAAHWPVQGGIFAREDVVVDTADYTYVPILSATMPSTEPMEVGYLHLDPEGNTVDTVHIPSLPDEPPLASMESAFAEQMVMTVRGRPDRADRAHSRTCPLHPRGTRRMGGGLRLAQRGRLSRGPGVGSRPQATLGVLPDRRGWPPLGASPRGGAEG